jgi:hypothetical protein
MSIDRLTITITKLSLLVLCLGLTDLLVCRADEQTTRIGVLIDSQTSRFTDKRLPNEAQVVGVKFRHADFIDSVELLYRVPGEDVQSLGKHGGNGGEEEVLMLDEGEFIRGISGKYGSSVDSLRIITNKRTSKRFGGERGTVSYEFVTPGDEVVGFFGQSGDFVDRLGVLVRPRMAKIKK